MSKHSFKFNFVRPAQGTDETDEDETPTVQTVETPTVETDTEFEND